METRRPGPVALVGSGEYLPVMEDVERRLIAGRPPRFVQLATAAAPEGPASLGRWHALGRASAERLGATQVVVPITRNMSPTPQRTKAATISKKKARTYQVSR